MKTFLISKQIRAEQSWQSRVSRGGGGDDEQEKQLLGQIGVDCVDYSHVVHVNALAAK